MTDNADRDDAPGSAAGPYVRCPLCLKPLDLADLPGVAAHLGPDHRPFTCEASAQARRVRDQVQARLRGDAWLN